MSLVRLDSEHSFLDFVVDQAIVIRPDFWIPLANVDWEENVVDAVRLNIGLSLYVLRHRSTVPREVDEQEIVFGKTVDEFVEISKDIVVRGEGR